MTKFADAPHTVDHAFDVDVTVSCANGDIAAVKELLTAKSLPVENRTFRYRVAAGDLAVFDIRTREERP